MTRHDEAPPRRWTALVEGLLDPADAEAILGDLEEEYREVILPERGPARARRWYRRMVLKSIASRVARGRAQRLRPLSVVWPNPGGTMERLSQDLRFSIRSLWRRPGFSLAIVATLGVAVGVNTITFALVDGVLIEPLPYADSDRLITLWQASTESPEARGSVSLPNFRDWRERSRTVDPIASYRGTTLWVTEGGDAEVVPAALVSDRFFEVLGAQPILGRGIATDEARRGGSTAVVLSHGYWQARFAGDSRVVGSALEIDGTPYTVVGIAPEAFDFPEGARLWVGDVTYPANCGRGCVNLNAIGRLGPSVTMEAALEEFEAIGVAMTRDYGMNGFRANIVSLKELVVGDVRTILVVLLAAVFLVLLIACANIANLLIARSRDRADELAIRASLGAGRPRMVAQLVTESAVLAGAGGVVGLVISWLGVRRIRTVHGLDLPRIDNVSLDASVLFFTVAAAVAAVLFFGLAPSVMAARGSLRGRIRRDPARSRGRSLLVATQVGLSVVLLVGTALMARTVIELRAVDLGFEADGVQMLTLSVPEGEVPATMEAIRVYEGFVEGLSRLPGVTSVGAAFGAPLSDISIVSSVDVEGWSDAERPANAGVRTIMPGYLETLDIPLLSGRAIDRTDRLDARRVILVNQTAARAWFGSEDPVGRVVAISASAGLPEDRARTVVGVVADTRFAGPRRSVPPEVYIPHAQNGVRFMEIFVASSMSPPALLEEARRVLSGLGVRVPLQSAGPLEDRVATVEAEERLWTSLLGLFTTIALSLAALGVFSVVAYQVALRQKEIGVRIAMGASGATVTRMILGQGLWPAVVGLALGLAVARSAVRTLEGQLFGVARSDPASWVGTALVLLLVAAIASLVPALRTVRVDPARTLRHE